MIEHPLSILVLLLGGVPVEYPELLHPLIVRVLFVLAVVKVRELCEPEVLYDLLILAHGRQDRIRRKLQLHLVVDLIH